MTEKKADYVTEKDGFKCEWRFRRSEIDCNVYGSDGTLISELSYPKLARTLAYVQSFTRAYVKSFTSEAVSIAQRAAANMQQAAQG